MDPPKNRNEVPNDGGDEFPQGTYGNSLTNVVQASTILLDTAQYFTIYADTFKSVMKEFTGHAEVYL
jgi:hypothetical protein